MDRSILIAVDAAGGDRGSSVMLAGAQAALEKDKEIGLIMVGKKEIVEPFAAAHDRVVACEASEVIGMDEHPTEAIKKKKDSSIVVGCNLVKQGTAQGFFSPGSTGACLAAATLGIGRIKGVKRPALCTVLPLPGAKAVLCDVGANADCKPQYLMQFGQMARAYAQVALDVAEPRVALLNIGEEETKGSSLALESYALMKEQVNGFIGNAEGNDIPKGKADVYVTDGFTGNVSLKLLEGLAQMFFGEVKQIMTANPLTKMGALPMMGGLKDLKNTISADEYGAAPLLGINGVCMVGHGSSNEKAIESGILATAKCIRMGLTEKIAEEISGQ